MKPLNHVIKSKKKRDTESELYDALVNYLQRTYVFRQFEIDLWLGDNSIKYLRQDSYKLKKFDEKLSAEMLWHEGHTCEWNSFSDQKLNGMYDGFLWENMEHAGQNRKRLIQEMIKEIIQSGKLVTKMPFNPLMKVLIEEGRICIRGSFRPLSYGSARRESITLEAGDRCYFSHHRAGVVNSAFVYRKNFNSYTLIVFSNQQEGLETRNLSVNTAYFFTANTNEIGLTPEQAAEQKYCG